MTKLAEILAVADPIKEMTLAAIRPEIDEVVAEVIPDGKVAAR